MREKSTVADAPPRHESKLSQKRSGSGGASSSSGRSRRRRNVTMSEVDILLKVLIFVTLSIVYFTLMLVLGVGHLRPYLQSFHAVLNWAGMLRTRFILSTFYTRELWHGYNGSDMMEHLTQSLGQTDYIIRAVSFGSEHKGIDSSWNDAVVNGVLFSSVCANAVSVNVQIPNCTAVFDGIMNAGLHVPAREIERVSKTLEQLVRSGRAGGAPGPVESQMYRFLMQMYEPPAYFKSALDTLVSAYNHTHANLMAWGKSVRVGLIAAFTVFLAVFVVVFFRPMIASVEAQMKRTSALLGMVPVDVVRSMRQKFSELLGTSVDLSGGGVAPPR